MRDAMAAERRGVPSVLVLNGALESIVEATSRATCMPDAPVIRIHESLFARTREEIAEIGRRRSDEVERALVSA